MVIEQVAQPFDGQFLRNMADDVLLHPGQQLRILNEALASFEEQGKILRQMLQQLDPPLTDGLVDRDDKIVQAAFFLHGQLDQAVDPVFAEIYVQIYGGEKDYLKTFAQLTQKDGSFIVSREKIDNFNINMLKGSYYIGGRLGGMPEMTLEYILNKNGIKKDDLTIDTSIAFANMQAAFISGTGDFVSLFEPNATQVENEGYGYVVASLGELGGVIPYTSYSAKISFIENNKDTIKKFTKAIQKGLDFVHNNDANTIAKIIKPEFPDTKEEDLINTIEQYKKTNTWPSTTNFTEESFNHMQDIMINANQLDKKVNYSDLIYKVK